MEENNITDTEIEPVAEVQTNQSTEPQPIEKLKKPKKTPKIKTEIKRKYNETYKMKKGIGEQLSDKIIKKLTEDKDKLLPKNNPTEVIIKQELPPPSKLVDDTKYVKKEKYIKMKETLKSVVSEMESLRNIVGSSKPKVNQMIYNELFMRR